MKYNSNSLYPIKKKNKKQKNRNAKKQNEEKKNQSNHSRTDTDFVHKDIKSAITTIFHMFKMLEERGKILSREVKHEKNAN